MDVTDVVLRLLRQRLAVALVVLLALAAAAAGYLGADTSRTAGAVVVIVPPKTGDVAGGDNPYLQLDGNMTQLAVVLASSLRANSVTEALDALGATGDFTVSTATGDNPSFAQLSPQLVITVTGPSDKVVSRTVTAVVAQARTQLAALQATAGVDEASRATLQTVVPPTVPEQVSSGRLRSAGALGLGVLVLGLILVLVLDVIRHRRRGTSTSAAPAPGVDAVAHRPAPSPTPTPTSTPTPVPEVDDAAESDANPAPATTATEVEAAAAAEEESADPAEPPTGNARRRTAAAAVLARRRRR